MCIEIRNRGINANDISQGSTGNCWFISAFSAVCEVEKYRNLAVPAGQSFDVGDYAGIFHFRFHQFGKIVDVCVDDFLPVDEEGNLIYASNSKESNEFFAPLFEKAYAKLVGSYEILSGGYPVDAMSDITGITFKFNR